MDYLPFAFAVAFAAVMFLGFPAVVRRGAGESVLTSAFTVGAYAQPVVDSAVGIAGSDVGHVLFHFAWAVLALPIAFALQRFRSDWPASGWTRALPDSMAVVSASVALVAIAAAAPRTRRSPGQAPPPCPGGRMTSWPEQA